MRLIWKPDCVEKVRTFAKGGNTGDPPKIKPQGNLISNIIKAKNASSYNERVQNSEDALARLHWFTQKNFYRKNGITYEDFLKQEGPLQNSFFLSGSDKDRYMLEHGYIKGKKGDYGIVKTAVGNEDLPVYQTKPDDINRDYLIPIKTIKNAYGIDVNGKVIDNNWFGNKNAKLNNAGHYSSVLYIDGRNPENFYQKAWDLNDYRPNLLNNLGYKAVQTTGYSKVQNNTHNFDNKQILLEEYLNEYLKQHNLTREVLDDGTIIYALPTVHVKSSAEGGRLIKLEMINYSKRGSKLINKCLNGERVNMSRLVTNSEGTPLKVDNNLLEELDNFLIKQNVGLPLRLAILYTVVQEGSTTGSHGNGAYGYLGWRGSRIPGKGVNLMLYLYDTIFGEFNKDLWNHGGVGSGYMSGREAQQSFINATNVNDALRSLNYGYVRPELELREFRSKTKYFNEDE